MTLSWLLVRKADRGACRLVQQYDISFVSTGDVLRKEIMAKSEVGKKAEAVVANGGELSASAFSLPSGRRPCPAADVLERVWFRTS